MNAPESQEVHVVTFTWIELREAREEEGGAGSPSAFGNFGRVKERGRERLRRRRAGARNLPPAFSRIRGSPFASGWNADERTRNESERAGRGGRNGWARAVVGILISAFLRDKKDSGPRAYTVAHLCDIAVIAPS